MYLNFLFDTYTRFSKCVFRFRYFATLGLFIFILSDASAQKITWENLFRVTKANFEMKKSLVLELGFNECTKFEPPVDGVIWKCLDCKREMQNNLQGTWFENIIICPEDKSIIYSTENSTYYNELKGMLKDRFSYLEILEDDGNESSEGVLVFKKGPSKVEFFSETRDDGFTQHRIKLSGENMETDTETVQISQAKYYALIIAEENYQMTQYNLKYPKRNADSLYSVLTTKYNFPKSNCVLLNNSPTRTEIFTELDKFVKLRKNDNLLIFFAGHGLYDKGSGRGYWLTSDYSGNLSNTISNLDLSGYLKKIKSHHILVISDACYSGSIFNLKPDETGSRAPTMNDIYARKSRQALTSGELEKVPDKSTFFESLMSFLNSNESAYVQLPHLVLNLEKNLMDFHGTSILHKQIYGRLSDCEDYGGEFIFMRQ
ncbi:MAG: caspase family protein [Bacteroidetes bacterium]|nr:MAG: caspase family protein [Bacteroidota bacterium]